MPEFVKLIPAEKGRTYFFPGGDVAQFYDVTAIAVSDSGTHRIETASGGKFIVPPGWLYIQLVVDAWTF